MTTHDEKILQLLDRIHTTAQSRREKAIDGAVQTIERVNRTSYGALRDLTQNGHKKAAKNPAARNAWASQELLVDDDHIVNAPAPKATLPLQTATRAAQAAAVAEAPAGTEITQVMSTFTDAGDPASTEATAIADAASLEATRISEQAPGAREYAARGREAIVTDDREHTPDEVVSGDGATYGGRPGPVSQQTQVIWFRRLFRRR